jgi:hypothetical protein
MLDIFKNQHIARLQSAICEASIFASILWSRQVASRFAASDHSTRAPGEHAEQRGRQLCLAAAVWTVQNKRTYRSTPSEQHSTRNTLDCPHSGAVFRQHGEVCEVDS